MTLVELTRANGAKVFVNLELVLCYDFGLSTTTLTLCTGALLEVNEGKDAFKRYLPK